MKLFDPIGDELEICAVGKNIHLKSKIPIARCWIKVSDPAGKIIFKKIEKDLTDTTISLNVKTGCYHVTLVTENRFATKTVLLK